MLLGLRYSHLTPRNLLHFTKNAHLMLDLWDKHCQERTQRSIWTRSQKHSRVQHQRPRQSAKSMSKAKARAKSSPIQVWQGVVLSKSKKMNSARIAKELTLQQYWTSVQLLFRKTWEVEFLSQTWVIGWVRSRTVPVHYVTCSFKCESLPLVWVRVMSITSALIRFSAISTAWVFLGAQRDLHQKIYRVLQWSHRLPRAPPFQTATSSFCTVTRVSTTRRESSSRGQ